MKKCICLLMVLVLAFSLFACSKGDDSDKNNDNKSVSNTGGADGPQSVTINKDDNKATIDKTILVDEGGLKITALNINYDYDDGYTNKRHGVTLQVDNNTGYDGLCVYIYSGTVNGYMIKPDFCVWVDNGESVTDILFCDSVKYGDTDIYSYFEFDIDAKTSERDFSYHEDLVMLKTSAYDTHKIDYSVDGTVIHDDKGVKITVTDINYDNCIIRYMLENKSGDIKTIQDCKLVINDIEVWNLTTPNKTYNDRYTFGSITFSQSDLEENNISQIEKIEISLEVCNDSFEVLYNTTLTEVEM